VERLRERAARHHRSLQGELMAIIEDAARAPRSLTPKDVVAEVKRLGIRSRSNSAKIVRALRDAR
jgi:antitoxin FitA